MVATSIKSFLYQNADVIEPIMILMISIVALLFTYALFQHFRLRKRIDAALRRQAEMKRGRSLNNFRF